ncbi:TPA: hypothetical protein EYP66_11875 [Candidatus Poribacteria bacterium]|nr:hypothetical protein [Candidatus Poribacteria bacterium]
MRRFIGNYLIFLTCSCLSRCQNIRLCPQRNILDKSRWDASIWQEEFPEIFIYYQEVDDKILFLGLGDISDCAKQAYQFLKGNPELRKRKSNVDILRVFRKRFLLR